MTIVIKGIIFIIVSIVIEQVVDGFYKKVKLSSRKVDTKDIHHYIVRINSLLDFPILGNVALALLILIVNIIVWKTSGKMGDGMVQFCLVYAGIFLLLYVAVKLWWIEVNEDNFVIHRFLRRTRKAKFSEVERVREDKWHQIVVYHQGHRLIRVNLLCENRDLFDASLLRYGVDMSHIASIEETIDTIEKKRYKK